MHKSWINLIKYTFDKLGDFISSIILPAPLFPLLCVKENLKTTQFGFAPKRQRPSGSVEIF